MDNKEKLLQDTLKNLRESAIPVNQERKPKLPPQWYGLAPKKIVRKGTITWVKVNGANLDLVPPQQKKS